jgi:uncharacterized protein involved in type VI secretion and phage assembly
MTLTTPVDGSAPGYFGVYPALVTDIVDREELGRIEVRFPTLGAEGDRDVRAWATLCTPYADNDQGLAILPEVGSEVVAAFEAGNFRRPYIVGSAWNGQAALPHPPEAANNIRMLRSRGDSRLEFDDTAGALKLSITMSAGHKVVLDDATKEITVQHQNGCSIRITAAGAVEIQANSQISLTAPALNVHSAVASFDGVVKCTTLQASVLVSSPAYTPGAGNLW